MQILYIGDIMGEPGVESVRQVLPGLRSERSIDLVIAQAENVTEGKGLSIKDFEKLRQIGIDFCSGGNWTLFRPQINGYLSDPDQPLIRPANYPEGTPGLGAKLVSTASGKVLVVSLLAQIVGKDADKPIDNPLKCIDQILDTYKQQKPVATVVNIHGDFSSEKVVLGYYLDGRASAVVGDHWHVPTADAMVLPKGTAHITDVGMCGILHASLGVKVETIVNRWRDNKIARNELETEGPLQFNAVLVDVDEQSGLARKIEQIQRITPGV